MRMSETQKLSTALASRLSTAFVGDQILLAGPLLEVALAVKSTMESAAGKSAAPPILAFDDASGGVVDLDLRGSKAEIITRFVEESGVEAQPKARNALEPVKRGRGRPKLGVTAKEVTLLPRHWQWLASQRGGASATLRRLVDDARKREDPHRADRAATDVAYRFMSAMAGDYPGFEDASRALFKFDRPALEAAISAWPRDVCAYLLKLAYAHRPTISDVSH
jgi:hypothetical protein